MINNFLTASPEMKPEYCAQVVRIGELKPIEGSDFLAQTLVSGTSMVVRKDEFKTGDYAIYCKNETSLNSDFLSVNNLYEKGEYMRNANRQQVLALEDQIALIEKRDKTEEDKAKIAELENQIKTLCGFFNKHGRVKMINLRKIPSFGFLIKLESLAKWKPQVSCVDLSKLILNEEMGIGMDFDTVCGEQFIKVYVPPVNERQRRNHSTRNERKRQKKVEKFERISKDDFTFHYDTAKLADNIWRIDPEDRVLISSKLHGTSFISSNIPVKVPVKLPLLNRFINWAYKKALKLADYLSSKTKPDYKTEYGNVYSSRSVIKNQYINKGAGAGYYGTDVWGDINAVISPYIEKGMTLYGEICGYLTGQNSMIQKGYDYGCQTGSNFLMPYRITTTEEDGSKREWEVDEVRGWTEKLLSEHPELNKRVHPITILYNGTLKDLYPDLSLKEHWHENVLESLRKDKKRFYMECKDPMCKMKSPFEGIVLRIANDPRSEAFKLKTMSFSERERKAIDAGEVDMEMTDAYAATDKEAEK